MADLNTIHAEVTDWKFDTAFELPEIPEPSGLCYCALTNTIFVVDDGGPDRQSGLYEINLDGNFKRGIKLGTDLEGVTYCAANQLLYVADEKDETIHIVEPKQLMVQGSFQISREFRGKELLTAGGNGFEGIAWIGSGTTFALVNQDDPSLMIFIALDDVRPGAVVEWYGYAPLAQRNIGEVAYEPVNDELWIVNSWLNTVGIVESGTLHGPDVSTLENPVRRWEVMPGMAQEGLTFDPQGRMWIGQDIGGVVRYVKP